MAAFPAIEASMRITPATFPSAFIHHPSLSVSARAIVAEARRALFNRENMVEIMVDSLILGQAAGVKTPPPQSVSRPTDAGPSNTLAAPVAAPNIGADSHDSSGEGEPALGISAEGTFAEAGVGRIGETREGRTSAFESVGGGAEQRRGVREDSSVRVRGGGTLVGLVSVCCVHSSWFFLCCWR